MMQFYFPAALEDCACGQQHTCAVQTVVIDRNALPQIPQILGEYKDILLVYDNNTWDACAKQVAKILTHSKFTVRTMHFNQDTVLVPDEDAIDRLLQSANPQTQAIVGVGAGVINDLCKWVSFKLRIPYMIVATAPSMDGFASTGAAMIIRGMKVTYNAQVPRWIIADTSVLRKAPSNLLRAGAGDILGKISSLNDWRISHIVTGETLCGQIYDLVMQQIDICQADLALINRRDELAIGRLMRALVTIGFCMSYVGNSRPASGSEHHLSHFFEVIGLLNKQSYLSHGLDVVYSTAITCALRHRLIRSLNEAIYKPLDQDGWNERIQTVYGPIAPDLIAFQKKVGFYGEARQQRQAQIKKQWPLLRSVLADVPSEHEITVLIKALGLSPLELVETYSKEKIKHAILFAKELKDRYTLLWLMQDMGFLDELAEAYIQSLNVP